ncbi:hypothetical protein [Sinorhizobium saheli]|uniref:hypothetical protein n=1 Tax=Sinorhizobium saheli TaxID=36856 RepID=UPI00389A1D01
MVHHFDKEEDAVRMFLDLLRLKRARGYRPNPRVRREHMARGRPQRACPDPCR